MDMKEPFAVIGSFTEQTNNIAVEEINIEEENENNHERSSSEQQLQQDTLQDSRLFGENLHVVLENVLDQKARGEKVFFYGRSVIVVVFESMIYALERKTQVHLRITYVKNVSILRAISLLKMKLKKMIRP